jgi:hypothetical protein
MNQETLATLKTMFLLMVELIDQTDKIINEKTSKIDEELSKICGFDRD